MSRDRFDPVARARAVRSTFPLLLLALMLGAYPVSAQSLRGSPVSLDLQNRVAREHDYTFIETPQRVRYFVEQGWLVRVRPTEDFTLHAVSFPYARPEVALFLDRLGSQYRAACGEQLVVTSLTRPTTRQPRNASARSVHPTGMAMDLRYSRDARCREWLERVLLSLEREGVLDVTRERYPVHYHVALFPRPYVEYVARIDGRRATEEVTRLAERTSYEIQPGDSLWDIARQHGTTVEALRAVNGLDGSRIYAGQVIDVPTGSR